MPRANPQTNQTPITIPFFITGLYTRRSPLFAPFRSLGVNIVVYHDSLLDGQDMEVTDLLEIQRRPGYSRFCSVQLGAVEKVNQFYSFRTLEGEVMSFFDSTTRWAQFTSTSITTLLEKTTTAQGWPYTVGDMTYYADGVDYFKLDQYGNVTPWGIAAPTVAPFVTGNRFWQPHWPVIQNESILDVNGNIEMALTGADSGQGQASSVVIVPSSGALSSVPHLVSQTHRENDWVNPNNAMGTLSWATCTLYGSNSFVNKSSVLQFTDFDFSAIPANATEITGILVSTTHQQTAGTSAVLDDTVLLLGLTGAVTDHAPVYPGGEWASYAEQETFGGVADTWGVSPTIAQIQSPSFGFSIGCECTTEPGTGAIIRLKGASITVYYNTSGGGSGYVTASGVSCSAVISNGFSYGEGMAVNIIATDGVVEEAIVVSGGNGYILGNVIVHAGNYDCVLQVTGITDPLPITGNVEPTWPTTAGTLTHDGAGITWEECGSILTWYPLASYTIPSVILDTNSNLQLVISQESTPVAWNSGRTYAPGDQVSYQGSYYSAVLPSTGIVPCSGTLYSITTGGATTSTPSWMLISNPNLTGGAAPTWSTIKGGTTADGSYTWKNIGPG